MKHFLLTALYIVLLIFAVMVQSIMTLHRTNQSLRTEIRMQDVARGLCEDQIVDLTFHLREALANQSNAETRGFVAGASAVLDNRNHYEALWHEGYDRGQLVGMEMVAPAAPTLASE